MKSPPSGRLFAFAARHPWMKAKLFVRGPQFDQGGELGQGLCQPSAAHLDRMAAGDPPARSMARSVPRQHLGEGDGDASPGRLISRRSDPHSGCASFRFQLEIPAAEGTAAAAAEIRRTPS